MAKNRSQNKRSARQRRQSRLTSGIGSMKLIAIKEECYAISGVATTKELKGKYPTLCNNCDFRKRKTWEYILKNLRDRGDWSSIRIADIEKLTEKERKAVKFNRGTLVFHPDRVEMDKAAENDD